MRILLFSSTYPPLIGGVETVTRRLSREFKERGHQVIVLTNRYPRTLARQEEIDGIRIIRRLFPNLLPSPGRRRPVTILKQLLALPLGAMELLHLYRRMKRLRPDVVNIHYFSYPAAYALIAARLAHIPAVLCFHGSDVPAVPYPATYRWTARWGCRLAGEIICCSGNLRDYLVQDLPPGLHGRVTISHYGIDGPGPSPAQPDRPAARSLPGPPGLDHPATHDQFDIDAIEDPFILLLARLVEKKGADVAIRALKELVKTDPSARLVIVGSGPLQAKFEGLAADLCITQNIIFAGAIAHGDAMALTERALFVIVPSYWEAFGMVCLEAMAAGKAVVAGTNGGTVEIVLDGQTGLLVPPGDPVVLANAMTLLLRDPVRAREIGKAGRRRASRHFTWSQMARRYEGSFQRAILAQSKASHE